MFRRRALLRAVGFGVGVSVPVFVLAYLVRAEAPGLIRFDEETIAAATSFTREHPAFLRTLLVWQKLLQPVWVNLAGGLDAWADAGRPLVTDDGSPGAVA